MKIQTALVICCTTILASFVGIHAQKNEDSRGQIVLIKKMDQQTSELMAGRVGIRKNMELKELAVLEEKKLIAEEDLMFPADELYASHWENKWVDPFQGKAKALVNFPDSFQIDCSSFVYPIGIDSMARVTSKYGPRRRRMHKGIDLKVLKGDTIRSAFDGKVRIKAYERRGYGYYVVIRHPNGLETIYGHLSKILVSENQIVRAGETIGLGGNTGRSTGSHLHFETRFLGQAINPAEIIDFENGVPHQDQYVFRNIKIRGRKSNIYTSSTNQMVYHRVKSGDTLGKIARLYGTTVTELCRLNGLKSSSVLRVGQSIRCSAGVEVSSSSKKSKTTVTKKATVKADVTTVASVAQKSSGDGKPIYHRVKSGDTLGAIATKYGTTIEKLCELNGIKRTTILRLGRSLRCS
jgi:murein DD-endopeptidase MepM/ murein hydrolase activator NlpD